MTPMYHWIRRRRRSRPVPPPLRRPTLSRPPLVVGLLSLCLLTALAWEMRTSTLQSRVFTPLAQEMTWTVDSGPSDALVFPGNGPYDLRLGYSRLGDMIESASQRGFAVAEQARVSGRFLGAVRNFGLFPIYLEKTQAGLEVLDRDRAPMFSHRTPERIYPTFESIPPVVWQTLLFIENRTALDPDQPLRNPAVEWGRLFRSTADLGLRSVGREGRVAGASTLATQIEKFRHAPDGMTETPVDKLMQMASASLRGYLAGPETLESRRRIVRDYLNSVPLAAIRVEGEIAGVGDGLWAWYGRDFAEVNRALSAIPPAPAGIVPEPGDVLPPGTLPAMAYWVDPARSEEGPEEELFLFALGGDVAEARGLDEREEWMNSREVSLEEQGRAYREVLSLLISQRRPSYHLRQAEGREALRSLTDGYLGLLERSGVISSAVADAARAAEPELRMTPPERPSPSFVERKAVNAVRAQLLGIVGVPTLYDLDRLDLSVRTTFDLEAQEAVTDFLLRLEDPEFVRSRNLDGHRLLDRGDPSLVIHSVVLHERTERGNLVRIQTDNLDAPFNLNESSRLELGSTAKLRTLASYLAVLADLHESFSVMDADSLRGLPLSSVDRLGNWTRSQLLAEPDLDLLSLLRRGMARTYSANPGERFVTGGGVQSFSNFDNTYDHRSISVTEGFRQSVNLVFVRMMRDIVNHYIYRVPGSTAHVLDEPQSPLRQEYLERFADVEGIQFLNQFYPKFQGKTRSEILHALVHERRLTPQRIAWVYRTAAPDPSVEEFEVVLRMNQPSAEFTEATVADLFRRADPEPHDLQDLGYLASVHPLELWVARYLIENPEAPRSEVIQESAEARQEVYRWLFRTSRLRAQDQRIRALLEVEAFTEILAGWRALGYPFQNIVPSLGTSIGSSGDRPAALGELVGIILNEGVRRPTYRVEELHFAEDTPFDTRMIRDGDAGERVMAPEVAQVLREAMVNVVEEGTARRMRGVLRSPDGELLTVGGKTGTGDNRYRVFGSGGRLLESRSVNRTSTFVFFIEDRYYGVVSAFVPGSDADRFWFTSALPTQILRELAPVIEELIQADEPTDISGTLPQGN